MPRIQNQIIARLPRRDCAHFIGLCDEADLVMSEVLCESGAVTRYVYFPISGFISLVTATDGKPVLEVGMVGSEGMLGAQLVLGVVTAPMHALVQGSGSALRIAAAPFRKELAHSKALRASLERYVYVLMNQMAVSAACLRFHEIGPRLTRWLLMTQDRARADSFHVTHEFLAYMLGVRRVGITVAAVGLQRRGLIRYHRGNVTIMNRRGLEAAACSCYAANNKAYADLMK